MNLQFTLSLPGLVMLVVGALMVINPGLLWKIEKTLYMKKGEPGDSYINICRTGGFLFVVWGIALFLGAPLPGQL